MSSVALKSQKDTASAHDVETHCPRPRRHLNHLPLPNRPLPRNSKPLQRRSLRSRQRLVPCQVRHRPQQVAGHRSNPPHTTTPRIKVALFGSLLVMLMLAASFGISFAVVEWRGTDGRESIGVDQAADWVACQLTVTNQIIEEGGVGFLLSEDVVRRMKDTCGITSDLWVLCAHDETFALPDDEQAIFGAGHAADIAESCREQVR